MRPWQWQHGRADVFSRMALLMVLVLIVAPVVVATYLRTARRGKRLMERRGRRHAARR